MALFTGSPAGGGFGRPHQPLVPFVLYPPTIQPLGILHYNTLLIGFLILLPGDVVGGYYPDFKRPTRYWEETVVIGVGALVAKGELHGYGQTRGDFSSSIGLAIDGVSHQLGTTAVIYQGVIRATTVNSMLLASIQLQEPLLASIRPGDHIVFGKAYRQALDLEIDLSMYGGKS